MPDRVETLLAWQTENALRIILSQTAEADLPNGLTRAELAKPRWQPWLRELTRALSTADTIEAISLARIYLDELGDRPKLLPAAVIDIRADDRSDSRKAFRFEVLARDDPRGYTIGVDTGCCMTLHGASRTCIAEGYRNPNATFVALYDLAGQLAAQSFGYVHPAEPTVFLLDNIETNHGRHFDNILQVYVAALQRYFDERPELGIQHVQIGEGYTDVGISHLPVATPVPPLPDVYTDAINQRILF